MTKFTGPFMLGEWRQPGIDGQLDFDLGLLSPTIGANGSSQAELHQQN
ncbi:MAG: hypothetical protein H5U01_17025 [Clostridia bacterium]|nr:hypothetical protein [Clostridia bacterium]